RRNRVRLLIVDPLYTFFRAHGLDPDEPFKLARSLLWVQHACENLGCTLLVVHPTSKGSGSRLFGSPPSLEDLAYGGFDDLARQWLLVNRRNPYVLGTGKHQLVVSGGGHDGRSGYWHVDIDEGIVDPTQPGGRRWDVQVKPANSK